MNTHSPQPRRKNGYISLMSVMGLSTVLLLILISAYRYSLQAQDIQRRAQIRIDYNQREQTILRSVLNIAPGRGMIAMMEDSATVATWDNPTRWRMIFEDAVAEVEAEQALDSDAAAILGVPSKAVSGNVGDGDQGHVRNVVSPIGQRRTNDFYITAGVNGVENTLGAGFPESLVSNHGTTSDIVTSAQDEDDNIYITHEKVYSDGSRFKELPYPDIHFGYTGQDQTFVAKRNWWAFTLGMGYTSEDQTEIAFHSKNYVLSIYEVPSQLALGSTSLTQLGEHKNGTAWADVSISGSVYATKAVTGGASNFDRIATRGGINLGSGTTVGGVSRDEFSGEVPTLEQFEADNASFYPMGTSSESGLVAFIPIDVGNDAYDDLSDTEDPNRVSPTGWNEYSRPAMQTVMKLRVEEVFSAADQTPTSISFTYKAGGIYQPPLTFTKGTNWPSELSEEGQTFPFHVESTQGGRKGIAVYIGRLVSYLQSIGADGLDVNSSLIVNANYPADVDIQKPNIPSLATDTVLLLKDAKDLSMFTRGFSLVTPFRLYIVDDVNLISSGTDLDGNELYPPISIFAPEKRFGIKTTAMQILFDGQLNTIGKNRTEATRPLDLKSGDEDAIVPENIRANLFAISDTSELPPITQMNWLVTIEEVR